jgi:large subunit ribosomal protein L10
MRPEKISMLSELRQKVEASSYVILTDFATMNVETMQALRKRLREVDAEFHVVKNRLFQHLAPEIGTTKVNAGLSGRTAVVTGTGEVTEVARVLREFIKEKQVPAMKMGALDGAFLSGEDLLNLANLPSKDIMRATLLGTLAAPMSQLVGVFSQKMSSLLYVLKAAEAKKAEG